MQTVIIINTNKNGGNLTSRWSGAVCLHTLRSLCWCEIPETLTAYTEPAVANMRAEIKPRHPLCPFITPSAPLLAATSPLTLRLGDNGSSGRWCDLHLDQWDICKRGTSANGADDVVLEGVKWTQTRSAGLKQRKKNL